MDEFPIRIASQLAPILRGFRKSKKITQAELGRRVGLSQKMISAIELRPERSSFEKILLLAHAMNVEIVLREKQPPNPDAPW